MSDRYAVIGNPISHTKSPLIHGIFAATNGQDMTYEPIEGRLDGFKDDVDAFRARGGQGLNVTAPFKMEAYAYATTHSDRAQIAGAANALKFTADDILAENFDGIGLTRDVVHNLGFPLRNRRVLVLGAGGATRGAVLPFLEQSPSCLVIANRTLSKAHAIAQACASHGRVQVCEYGDLSGETFDVVFNATSASLRGELPPVPATVFGADSLAYELVYGKGLTPFLRLAQATGMSRLADGVGMLVEQAAEAFAWWRGVRPDTRQVIDSLTVPLA